MEDCCAVCAEPLEWVAYGFCGHREVCSNCVARLRFILEDRRCCICKSESSTVFVTRALGDYTQLITDFSVFFPDAKEGRIGRFWYHEDTQSFFDDIEQYKMIKAMCRLSCSVCDNLGEGDIRRKTRFRSIEQLKGHLFHKHKLLMCNLCLEGRKVFICEQKLYSRLQLRQHISAGISEVDGTEIERGGFRGHPMCEFCRNPFYGENELYMHMSTEHYTCHLCQRQNPGQYDYYKNYDNLEIHFRNEHFLCENESCLARKFIVFQSEPELKRHNALEHAGHMSRSKRNAALQIPISFRFRRSNGNVFHHVRGRQPQERSSDDQPALAIDPIDESVDMNLELVTLSPIEVESGTGRSSDVDAEISHFGSLTVASSAEGTSSRYLDAVIQNSKLAHLEEASFPPLAGSENRNMRSNLDSIGQKESTMAAHLWKQHGGIMHTPGPARMRPWHKTSSDGQTSLGSPISFHGRSTSFSSQNQIWPRVNEGTSTFRTKSGADDDHAEASIISAFPSKNVQGSHKDMKPSSLSSSFTGRSSSEASQHSVREEDVQAANKSLIESIRAALHMDEDRYATFKGITAEFRQNCISTCEYLACMEQFGLSHLILDLARLCPDSRKQQELIEIYQENLLGCRADDICRTNSKTKLNKGKGKLTDERGHVVYGDINQISGKASAKNKKMPKHLAEGRDTDTYGKALEEVDVLSKDGYRSAKGKSQSNEQRAIGPGGERSQPNENGSVQHNHAEMKCPRKTSKFLRLRLGEDLGEAADVCSASATTTTEHGLEGSTRMSDRLPNQGAWNNGGGQKLISWRQRNA